MIPGKRRIGATARLYAIGPAVQPLARLYRSLSHRRRRQLLLMLVVMLIGAGAELVTIGAVLPFLAFLTRGGRAAMPGAAARWLAALGVDGIFSASILLIAGAVGAAIVRLLLLWLNQRYVMAGGPPNPPPVFRGVLRPPPSRYFKSHNNRAP